jgi:hypothetical protein
MSKVIKITQCKWCGKVKTVNGEWVDLGLPIFYLEFFSRNPLKSPMLRFDLETCVDCDTKECGNNIK